VLEVNISFLFYLLAFVLFAVATFPVASRFNLMAAGLASAMLGFLIAGGLLHG
jgi:hypothetical protein